MTNDRQRRVAVSLALAVSSILVADSAHAQGVSFIARRDFDVGSFPQSVAVGDFNGDGVQDLAVANAVVPYGTVSVLLGNGDGTFQAPLNFRAGVSPSSVAVGDFNGGGVEDLAVASRDSYDVSVLLGNGDGSFQAARNFGAGNGPVSVAVGDFNGDGVQGLAVANAGSANVSVLINNTPQPPAKKVPR